MRAEEDLLGLLGAEEVGEEVDVRSVTEVEERRSAVAEMRLPPAEALDLDACTCEAAYIL